MIDTSDILFLIGIELLFIIGGAISVGASALLISALLTIVYGTSDIIRMIPFTGVIAGAIFGPVYGYLETG